MNLGTYLKSEIVVFVPDLNSNVLFCVVKVGSVFKEGLHWTPPLRTSTCTTSSESYQRHESSYPTLSIAFGAGVTVQGRFQQRREIHELSRIVVSLPVGILSRLAKIKCSICSYQLNLILDA